ncbi:D-glycero-D-manno-heptose 1-phosphate guanosyltransferase [Aliidongia dinghuensis]|uniref:D-glycero-D-manno-heptose 1-phosphate guanosyltransferase n=1 Tax=Aliidongia dinghuensis TaxID=1867774 RepID=A0A8J2YW84_9PROT|nr:nucleotidyltransferase family protein [Aliidongia dinghuensis]GGF23887.1 D-glycero-D-manno-heptose 1-phosphate guanosyltransferase [Aliidongia dinghuensis]
MKSELVDCIVLAGGKGTRLASVLSAVPKPLAPVAGRPFLDYVLDRLAASGVIGSAVLALGHLADQIVDHYSRCAPPLPVRMTVESEPLGTGGALRHALPLVTTDTLFATNGDSIVSIDWQTLLDHHRRTGAGATLALVSIADAARFGSVRLDGDRVVEFIEKKPGKGLINAGIYVLSRDLLATIAPGPCSFERDILPHWVERGLVTGVAVSEELLDIGLPETYADASRFLARQGNLSDEWKV